ncbi:MAG TPA: hypothetical protein VM370_00830 [Candidatus Thermoplasmatota archaeon]|nr:hypothetical protein [Candidatus Thermoplasmatota archaeon]
MRLALLLVLLLAAPAALAQSEEGNLDVRITLAPHAEPEIDAPPGLVRLANATSGELYAFDLALTQPYTTFEVRARSFDITRPRQIVPSLRVDESAYPLFYEFPNERIWDVDEPARVFFANGSAADVVLRLGIPGPANVTLVLARDVTPPTFTLGEVTNITTYGFYQETTTNELAIGDIQVRAKGANEWVVNPTPTLHFRQRFPVQGLDAGSEYEVRAVFTDWAGNNVTSDVYTVRSADEPMRAPVDVTPLAPPPNATLPPGAISVRAKIDATVGVPPDGVRVFFDKKEVSQQAAYDGVEVRYTPSDPVGAGHHSVSVEVTDSAGGKGLARWSFDVTDGTDGAPLPPTLAAGALVLAAALLVGGRGSLRR